MASQNKHIAFYLDHLGGGGIQKVWLIVAGALAQRGHPVDLVVCQASGPLLDQIPPQVRLVELSPGPRLRAATRIMTADHSGVGPLLGGMFALADRSNTQAYFPDLVRYLREKAPASLFSATPHMNIEALLAKKQAGAATRLIVSEHNTIAPGHPLGRGLNRWYLSALLGRLYPSADAVVAVSKGVAADVASRTGLTPQQITTIYNPVVTPTLLQQARQPLDHPWFQPGEPAVILGVGRLGRAKDFPTLIRAFARVRQRRAVRLMILGEAKRPRKTLKRRNQLMALAAQLGVAEDVALPGFVQNPYRFMARAGIFVLSSRYEGLGNVLIEAMACGCPVVSTDCPSGPSEILDSGRYGPLVPVGDEQALARAMQTVLDAPPAPERLQERAAHFSVTQAVNHYLALLS